jgi:hypothetical protein
VSHVVVVGPVAKVMRQKSSPNVTALRLENLVSDAEIFEDHRRVQARRACTDDTNREIRLRGDVEVLGVRCPGHHRDACIDDANLDIRLRGHVRCSRNARRATGGSHLVMVRLNGESGVPLVVASRFGLPLRGVRLGHGQVR